MAELAGNDLPPSCKIEKNERIGDLKDESGALNLRPTGNISWRTEAMTGRKQESIGAIDGYISRWKSEVALLLAAGRTTLAKEFEVLIAEAEKMVSELKRKSSNDGRVE